MIKRNGIVVKWMLGILAALVIGLAGWTGRTLISHGERIATTEVHQSDLRDWLGRVEEKLDRALGLKP